MIPRNHLVKGETVKFDSLDSIAERARLARKEARLSQTAVHEAGGPSRPTLYRIENALPIESLESQLQRLAMVTGHRWEWIYTGDGEKHLPMAAEAPALYHADPPLDVAVLGLAIETLEIYLALHRKKLDPKAKAQAVVSLYTAMRLWRPEALTAANVTPLVQALLAG